MVVLELSDVTWQYLAGFTDGDGTMGMYGKKRGGDVRVAWLQAEANSWILVELMEFLDLHEISYKSYSREKEGRTYFTVRVTKRESVEFLLSMLEPHLILKRPLAQTILSQMGAVKPWGDPVVCPQGHLWSENLRMNNRGVRRCNACDVERSRNSRKARRGE